MPERLHFHYDQQGNLIAESDNQGNIIREYIYLGSSRIAMTSTSLDNPSVIPDARPRDPGSQRRHARASGQPLALYFIHNDHLGTPQKVTDTDQRIVWSMEQTPFGEVSLMTAAIRMPMRFPGQYANLESGFSYNYFRDYDPSLWRYIQSDPVGLIGGPHTFTYSLSNPVRYSDDRGLFIGEAIAVALQRLDLAAGRSIDEQRIGGMAADSVVSALATGGVNDFQATLPESVRKTLSAIQVVGGFQTGRLAYFFVAAGADASVIALGVLLAGIAGYEIGDAVNREVIIPLVQSSSDSNSLGELIFRLTVDTGGGCVPTRES